MSVTSSSTACALCQNTATLRVSHIIPKFVWKHVRETGVGALRTTREPNRRVQDGPQLRLLCSACEQRLSEDERAFQQQLFGPLHAPNPESVFHYEGWAERFAVSVAWRVIRWLRRELGEPPLSEGRIRLVDEADATWRGFLLGEIDDLGCFEQHLLPVDVLAGPPSVDFSPYLNRYNLRIVHMGLLSTESAIYTYVKLCKVILLGRIQEHRPTLWKGTRLGVSGTIRPRRYHIPHFLDRYMNMKADEVSAIHDALSDRQAAIVDEFSRAHQAELKRSEYYWAFEHDLTYSGPRALRASRRPGHSGSRR